MKERKEKVAKMSNLQLPQTYQNEGENLMFGIKTLEWEITKQFN